MAREISPADLFGRDHHPRCSPIGSPAAASSPACIGSTDDYGYNVAENPVHVNDLHATILHCLGIDHERLTYRLRRPRLPLDRFGGQGGA